jgi:hypothetical protein
MKSALLPLGTANRSGLSAALAAVEAKIDDYFVSVRNWRVLMNVTVSLEWFRCTVFSTWHAIIEP